MEDVKYPIKYAIMPIIGQVGWTPGLHELEREYDVIAYIVSKCYVLSEKKLYKKDGGYNFKYEVIFPYIHDYYFDEYKRIVDIDDGDKIIVSELFDNYNDVLEYCDKENATLCRNLTLYRPIQKMKEAKQEFFETLSKYKVLEERIEKETTDMIITKDSITIDDMSKLINGSKVKVIER